MNITKERVFDWVVGAFVMVIIMHMVFLWQVARKTDQMWRFLTDRSRVQQNAPVAQNPVPSVPPGVGAAQ